MSDKIYNYNGDKIFLSSDRITFNARKDSIFLSAYKHIHVGCGSSMTFSTSENILTEAVKSVTTRTGIFTIECDKMYIDGREKIIIGNPILDDTMHKAVLGDSLVTQLSTMFFIMKEMCLLTSAAIENRALPGGSYKTMKDIVGYIDQQMGVKKNEKNIPVPTRLNEFLLSDKVYIKK